MPLDVAIYGIHGHKRSSMCCQAMYAGIRAAGDRPRLFMEADYRVPEHDLAVFYGYTQILRRVMADYIKAGRKAVYIDLGYWDREGMRGHHKIVVNARHPTAYFDRKPQDGYRAGKLGVKAEPWRKADGHILLAGMGEKAAEAEGQKVEKFEYWAIAEIRKITDREIVYRPKPSWIQARKIAGTIHSPKAQPLAEVLANCHAVVTHHSNVAVEGLCAGVPAFCWGGVAAGLSSQDLSDIERPYYPEGRSNWINAISYTQWNIDEMTRGLPWRHLKSEGLIP